MAVVVAIMFLAIGIFAVSVITSSTDGVIKNSTIENILNTENFNSETVNTEPNTTFMDYTAYGWTTSPGINGTTGAFNYTVGETDSTWHNYSRWNISTNEIGFPNRILFDVTQGLTNMVTVINVTNSAGATYANIVINASFISISIGGTEHINRSGSGLFDKITYDMNIQLVDNTTVTVRVIMTNSTGTLNTTGYRIPSSLGAPGKIIVTGGNSTADKIASNITIDDIRVWAKVWPTMHITDAQTIANSVFNILGVVLIMAVIMAIVGIVYTYQQKR